MKEKESRKVYADFPIFTTLDGEVIQGRREDEAKKESYSSDVN